ncbi:MAG TPA: PfkB family carbohydrate kinase [Candidatus Brocadiia bacterium]|nr:PfkB family carbohydrate kinase [Candidatus Brocadiia bacterium]
MSLCVVGSIAFDTIETPHGKVERALGGSAVYFSAAARLLAPVRLAGVVGDDFPPQYSDTLKSLGVDLAGLQRKPGKTFAWWGRYSQDMNQRQTIEVHLNVFGEFLPEIPQAYRDSQYVFLANGSPVTQASLLDQMRAPRFVMADTMDLWIEKTRPELLALLKRVDAVVLNDSEARQLSGKSNLITASRAILGLGPKTVIVKKGEHGAMLVTRDSFFALPAYPCETVRDPTGAGDSFAGGVMGWLAKAGKTDAPTLKAALACGTIMASFCVEDFGVGRLTSVQIKDVEKRLLDYRGMLSF